MGRSLFSILCPAVLFFFFLINNEAFSQGKSRNDPGRAAADGSLYPGGYDNRAVRSGRDIISFNDSVTSAGTGRQDIRPGSGDNLYASAKTSSRSIDIQCTYYTVKKGDTLYRISRNTGVSVDLIAEYNRINSRNSIKQGMRLKIPRGKKLSGEKAVKREIKGNSSYDDKKPGFTWPLKTVYGYKRDGDDSVKAIGIIIKSSPKAEVIASETGVVKRVGYMRGFGKYVVVKHDNRYMTVYSNLMFINVKEGETVRKGCSIGRISDDRTLHFQIDYAGKPKNPLNLLPARG